jgi:glycosyltransferase involved in cell wall biosynthesis
MPANERQLSIAMIGTRGIPAREGGVEVAVEALSQELAKRGHRVTVYGRRAYCDPDVRERHGVRQIPLGQVNTKHLEAISHTVLATTHALLRERYDLVHFHASGPSLLSWAPRFGRAASVATLQGADWKREKWGPLASRVLRVAMRVAATAPDETIVVSRALQRSLLDSYGRACHVIPNGVDASAFDRTEPIEGFGARPFVLFLGRLVPEKQVHTLIRAFSRVPGDVQLVIAGSSSHSDGYVEAIKQLASADRRVALVGSRHGPEKAWLLRNAAVFVQPSSVEGLPIALLEALACGCLTVVSDIPENLEAVTLEGGRPFGFVFRTGQLDDLASKLVDALSNPVGLRGGDRVRSLVREQFSWQTIAQQTEAVYWEAIERRSGALKG